MFPRRAATEVGSGDNDAFAGNIVLRVETVEFQILEKIGLKRLFRYLGEVPCRDNFIGVYICSVQEKDAAGEVFHCYFPV